MNKDIVLTINMDYHNIPLGLSNGDIDLTNSLGFPVTEIVKYIYKLYLFNALKPYTNNQEILTELVKFHYIFELTNYAYELEILEKYLYTNALSELELQLENATNLSMVENLSSKINTIKFTINTRGKQIDALCKVIFNLNNYIITNSLYYLNPVSEYCNKTNVIGIQPVTVHSCNIVGAWMVTEFTRG